MTARSADVRERIARVAALGHGGDGVVFLDGERVHVPGALAGETVRLAREDGRWRLSEVVEPAPARVTPICRHFGACGGCALQHFEAEAALAWKREQMGAAFAQRGLDVRIEPVVAVPPQSRRRLVVAAQRRDGRVVVGFRARLSHDVVAVTECPVARPALAAALPAIGRLASLLDFGPKGATVTLLETETGLDVAIRDAICPPERRARLVEAAIAADFARLSLGGEILVALRAPVLDMGGVALVPPPGGFVQASRAAELILAEAVLDATGSARRVLDLFAGSGTFALRLARRAAVHAVEGDRAALEALAAAARHASGLRPVGVEVRDLVRCPYGPAELDRFDAVVFDPPRDGAAPQAKNLAKSTVPVIIAVSCNPATLARDLRFLVDGGYVIERVLPVDQFPFTPHIETVAVLRRHRLSASKSMNRRN